MDGLKIDRMSERSGRFLREDDSYINYADKDGFHITDTERNALAEGNTFGSGYIFEAVAASANTIVHFKTGSKICVMSYGVGSDGSCDYGVYTEPVVTVDGTLFGNHNRNMVTVKESTAKTYYTPTTTDNGDVIIPRINGGSSGPAKGGSTGSDAKLLVLPADTSILIIVTNKSTTASRINIVIDWIEVE
jgi:hypothetical protein